MAEGKQFLDYTGLKSYDGKLKTYIGEQDSAIKKCVDELDNQMDTLVANDGGKSIRTIAQEVANSIPTTTVEINSISTEDIDSLFG